MKIRAARSHTIKALIAAIMAAVCFSVICGCSGAPRLKLTVAELSLFVGDSRDIAPYAVFEPAATEDKSFTLKADGDCVSIRGTVVTAEREGTAVVTASNGEYSVELKITVGYRAAHAVTLDVDGDTVQTSDSLSAVDFTASLDDFANPSSEIVWTINGERVGQGETYAFEPRSAGEYEVRATADGVFARQTVYVYAATEAAGKSDGALYQLRDFSAVRFYAVESKDPDNPPSVYRWTVNGETASTRSEFTYAPLSAGEYAVELYVNGVKRNIDGNSRAVITAAGERAPSGRAEFDDRGGVFIEWSDGGGASSVSITEKSSGARNIYSSADSRYSHLFGDGFFDATDFISPCSTVPRTYTVTVIADAAGEHFDFTQYPLAAQEYISQNVVCNNSFLSDGEQAAEWVRELYATGALSAKGYLSREVALNTDAVLAAINESARSLGLTVSATVDGNILSVEFGRYVNGPTTEQSSKSRQTRAGDLHFETAHSANLRDRGYRLKIERAGRAVEVENGEQLLIAVQNGVRPLPKSGSVAAHIFSAARASLLAIVGKDYTDAQKAHAVYDWLQFCTLRVESEVGGVADYLEGVFGDGKKTPALVVSDAGAAKAFALLCGMEGISCKTLCSDGDHFNAVEIDGLRYNVDVYDGEAVLPDTDNERVSHAGLFYADGEPADAHSAYDTSLSHFLQKRWHDGVYFDNFIGAKDDIKTVAAAIAFAFSRQTRAVVEIHMPSGIVQYANTDFGAEFSLSDGLNEAGVAQAIGYIERAAREYVEARVRAEYDGDDLQERIKYYVDRVRVARCGDVVFVTAQIPSF